MTLAHLIGWLCTLCVTFFAVIKPTMYVVQDTKEHLQLAGVMQREAPADAPLVRGHLIFNGNQAVGFMPCLEDNTRNYPVWVANTRAVNEALPHQKRSGKTGRVYVEVRASITEITDQYAYVQRDKYEDQVNVGEVLVMRDERFSDCREHIYRRVA